MKTFYAPTPVGMVKMPHHPLAGKLSDSELCAEIMRLRKETGFIEPTLYADFLTRRGVCEWYDGKRYVLGTLEEAREWERRNPPRSFEQFLLDHLVDSE